MAAKEVTLLSDERTCDKTEVHIKKKRRMFLLRVGWVRRKSKSISRYMIRNLEAQRCDSQSRKLVFTHVYTKVWKVIPCCSYVWS